MEISSKTLSSPEKHEHMEFSSSHFGLYQQLYVPQFNAPNPNMVELEKLYKKYPKLSKPLFILNIVLAFILLFNISHKFNWLSWNLEKECGHNEVFLSFGVVSSLLWLTNCFVLGYSIAKKAELGLKVYYWALKAQLGMLSLAGLLRIFWSFSREISISCQFTQGEAALLGTNTGMEIILILIFMLSSQEMRKVLTNIQLLREKILTPIVYELNEEEMK